MSGRDDTSRVRGGPVAGEPLPELLDLDLDELRTVQHPVLREVLEGLRERAERPGEMLWGFNSAM
ncbi:FxSxx-COOH cyclophane-containing RiPP peptide [Streptomyces sp. NPDC005917]|uniref:FxSxx-COOH cyclophane-containing RiPP peptide n=1 Tax=unclassified Streptomyces TaxID=2593676 RepID=UPI0033EFD3BB